MLIAMATAEVTLKVSQALKSANNIARILDIHDVLRHGK
jgi:hypothetical protein